MRVPVSFTSSAVTPCGFPNLFTRSRNAGGNAYSRPQSRPTFIAFSSHVVGARRLLDAVARFLDDRLHHASQIAGLSIHGELSIRARAVGDDRAHVLHLAAAAELADHLVDKREQLERALA